VILRSAAVALLAAAIALCSGAADADQRTTDANIASSPEVFYQIFVRSFRDSNGDGNGDLQGIINGLDYLQSLGVTDVLLTPLYPSHFYHNYFAYDFYGIDPEYGTMADFHRLVAALHARGMKLFLDEEIQYTESTHPWFAQSLGRPDSPYSGYILYTDADHMKPATGPFGLATVGNFSRRPLTIGTVNLKSPAVQAYFREYFRSWIDPDGDGKFDDGVDGFRIDHMMDDLDDKPSLTNLFATFWRPLIASIRALNPKLRIIAEQAGWGYGGDFLEHAGVDYVFAFPLRASINTFDKDRIAAALQKTAEATPPGKGQLIFIENHDTARAASRAGITPEKLRTAAALNLLLAGTPLIYYGQELGMRGSPRDFYKTDERDIGDREAFRWKADDHAPMEANWYRRPDETYWTERFNRGHDGVSVEEEDRDPHSLLNFYRLLLRVRRAHAALRSGAQRILASAPDTLVIERGQGDERLWLVSNLSGRSTRFRPTGLPAGEKLSDLLGRAGKDDDEIALAPWQSAVVQADPRRRQ
jgi:glycosidase